MGELGDGRGIAAVNADGTGDTQQTQTFTGGGLTSPDWSGDGTRLVATDLRNIFIGNADGTGNRQLTAEPSDYSVGSFSPAFSPGGSLIAYTSTRDGNSEIYTVATAESATPVLTRLTTNDAADHSPAWEPDSRRIAFISNRSGADEIYVMERNGTGVRQLTSTATRKNSLDWAPDGSMVLFDDGADLYTVNITTLAVKQLTHPVLDQFGERINPHFDHPSWSPDGMRIAATAFFDDLAILDARGALLNLVVPHVEGHEPDWQPRPCTITGTDGADTIEGTSGRDVICGKGGNDTIHGRDGSDTIIGGAGADVLSGGMGSDAIVGGTQRDTLTGNGGTDRCDGGTGLDHRASCEEVFRVP